MTTLDNDYVAKSSKIYECIICHYNTCKKYNYDKHVLTAKHKINIKNKDLTIKNNENVEKSSKKYSCEYCEKSFNDRAGLWRHKRKCNEKNANNINEDNNENNLITDKDLIISLLKQNAELLEIVKNGTNNTIMNNCHNNNKTFNLQVFLNETCKDAMNIMDFVDSIKLQLTDLETVGELGYVKGMSNIIVKNLKALDVTKRPVHCSDIKREVLYIKDNDKWEKEDPENNKLRKAIKYISHKNILLLSKWREKYPDSQLSDSPQSDKYHHMVMEAMGGEGSTEMEKMNKIIRNIAKEVTIEK